MKIFSCILMLIFSMNSDNNNDFEVFQDIVLNYTPKTIDLSTQFNKEISNIDIEFLYDKKNEFDMDDLTKIILLKLCLYHYKSFHQGYNLLKMRNGKTAYIIDHYIKINNLSKINDFISSGIVYDIEKNKINNNLYVKNLIDSINYINSNLPE